MATHLKTDLVLDALGMALAKEEDIGLREFLSRVLQRQVMRSCAHC